MASIENFQDEDIFNASLSAMVESYTLADLPKVAEKVMNFNAGIKVITFEGEMGSGKTTLIKEICTQLKVIDKVSSPTFSLVNEYITADNSLIYHFDFYRLNIETEAMDIGCDEYFYSGNYCLIEWPSKIPSYLPVPRLEIMIDTNNENTRRLTIKEIL